MLSRTPLVGLRPQVDLGSTKVVFSPLRDSLSYPRRRSFLTLRVGMQFVTLRVTRRFCDVRWIGVRLRSPLLSQAPLVPHAPRGNAVRDALRHTAV
ncbi:hypothetical protein ALQ73_04856, partial [Pseudomonas savastanoi pv. glycinea]